MRITRRANVLGNVPFDVINHQVVSVLAVLAGETDRKALQAIFGHTNWRLENVSNCQEARRLMDIGAFSILVCDVQLCDGDWTNLLTASRPLARPPILIVASDNGGVDRWAEVLNRGGYDMLLKPFNQEEVVRIISLAWLYWRGSMIPPMREESIDRRLAAGA